jgi:hypothetical protein
MMRLITCQYGSKELEKKECALDQDLLDEKKRNSTRKGAKDLRRFHRV